MIHRKNFVRVSLVLGASTVTNRDIIIYSKHLIIQGAKCNHNEHHNQHNMSCAVQIVHNVHTVPNSYRKVTTKSIIVHTNIYHKLSLPPSLTLTLVTESAGT